jgi:hypothetical protein
MKSKAILTIITLIIILTIATLASAQTVNAGVSQNDIFEYNYNATWNSTNPSASPSNNIVELLQIKSFQIKITSVSGSNVNAEVTKKYQNDTTKTETGFVDVQSGSIHLEFGTLIIAANRTVNQTIYPTWTDAIINETVTRTYQNGDRETNKRLVEITSEYGYEKTEVYYDKVKGIAVDSYFESRDSYGGQTEIFTETITNTNSDVWTAAPPSPTPTPSATPASSTPAASQSPAPSSVVPELSVFVVPLVLFGAAASVLMVKGVKRFSC